MEDKPALNEQLRRSVVEKMYLNYFNNSLLEQGYITLEQHRKMKLQIANRKSSTPTR